MDAVFRFSFFRIYIDSAFALRLLKEIVWITWNSNQTLSAQYNRTLLNANANKKKSTKKHKTYTRKDDFQEKYTITNGCF